MSRDFGRSLARCTAMLSTLAFACAEQSDSRDDPSPTTPSPTAGTNGGVTDSGGTPSGGDGDQCGDGECDGESCESCPEDCGECIPCGEQDACEGALVPPPNPPHADQLDDIVLQQVAREQQLERIATRIRAADPGARLLAAILAPATPGEHHLVGSLREVVDRRPDIAEAARRQLAVAGVASTSAYRDAHRVEALPQDLDLAGASTEIEHACEGPLVRVRVAHLDVFEEDDDVLNDVVYCVITAESGEETEIRVTPQTPPLDEMDDHPYSLAEGIVWGQADLAAPDGNLALTYQCFESDTGEGGFGEVLAAIRAAAEAAGGLELQNGWIFDAVGVAAALLAELVALDNDDRLLAAMQIVSADAQAELSQGAYWNVRRNGVNLNSAWDWQLRMEIWGCGGGEG